MAMSLTLFSIIHIYQRLLWRFLSVIALASLFHTSALIFLPFYWLSQIRFRRRMHLVAFMVISLLFSVQIKSSIQSSAFLQYILSIESFLHYGSYLNEDAEIFRSISILSIGTLQRIIVWAVFVYNVDKIKCEEGFKSLLMNGYTIAVVLFVVLSFSAEFAARLSYYYKALEIILIPLVISSQQRLVNRFGLLCFFAVLYFVGVSRLLTAEQNGLIPYKVYPIFSNL